MNLLSTRRIALALGLGVGSLALAAPFASAHDDHGDPGDPTSTHPRLSHDERTLVRHATQHLRTPRAATAAGYLPADDCVELPGVGGMGYHYVNPAYLTDGQVIPARPEILVFVPTRDGGRRLGGVEYFQADADQDVTTDSDRPALFGLHGFDGPMPGHDADMPVHYDLHAWLFKHNPAGQLSAWNPRVHCPAPAQ